MGADAAAAAGCGYDPRWLDALCLTGVVGWGRISPHPAFATHGSDFGPQAGGADQHGAGDLFCARRGAVDGFVPGRAANSGARLAGLPERAGVAGARPSGERGAVFAGDLVRVLGAPAEEVNRALWELVAAGLVTADGFDSLRVLIDPRRKAIFQGGAEAAAQHGWAVEPAQPRRLG